MCCPISPRTPGRRPETLHGDEAKRHGMKINTLSQGENAIAIRAIVASDRPQWEALYRQYAAFYHVAISETILENLWSWLMTPAHPMEGLVAELTPGDLVGLAHYRPFPEPLLGQDAGFLDDLFVLATQRGQGIGRDLIAAVAAVARDRGWPLLRWITAQDNAQARRLYDGMAQATAWVTYDFDLAPHKGHGPASSS